MSIVTILGEINDAHSTSCFQSSRYVLLFYARVHGRELIGCMYAEHPPALCLSVEQFSDLRAIL